MNKRARVMVVAKEQHDVDYLCNELADWGYLVQGTIHPLRVLQVDSTWPLDLIVAHDRLAGMLALDLINNLRVQNPSVSALVITDDMTMKEVIAITSDGSIKFISQPYDRDELEHYVRMSLNVAKKTEERRDHTRFLSSLHSRMTIINPFNERESTTVGGLTRDVSRSGLALLTHQMVPVPTMLRIEMTWPHQSTPLSALGKTLSCTLTPMTNVYRVGVKFVGLLSDKLEKSLAECDIDSEDNESAGHSYLEAIEDWLHRHPEHLDPSVDHPHQIAHELVDRIIDDIHSLGDQSPKKNGKPE